MKIAQVCPYNYYRAGGVQEHVRYLSEELRRLGHEVKILAPKIKGQKRNEKDVVFIGKGVEIFVNKTQSEFTIVMGKASDKIRSVLDKEKFDLIHYQEPCSPVMSIQILYESDATSVATFHASLPNTFLSKSIEILYSPLVRTTIKHIEELIAVTEVPKKFVKNYTNRKIQVIPNGINLNVFSKANKKLEKYNNEKVKILFFGRIDQRKGIMHLLKVYRKLRKKYSNIQLIVGGKGDDLRKAEKYVEKYDVKDVDFLGFVSEEDKPNVFASCDVFCSPAMYGESQGIVLLEAMASGKSVVAYANRGYKTVLSGTGSLFLAKPRNKKQLYRKLELLINDAKLRKFMGEWGVEESKKYSWRKIAKEVEKVYVRALEKKKTKKEKRNKKTLGKILKKWIKKAEASNT